MGSINKMVRKVANISGGHGSEGTSGPIGNMIAPKVSSIEESNKRKKKGSPIAGKVRSVLGDETLG